MKQTIFTLLMMSFVFALQAQDFIYLRDGSRVKAKVQSVDKKGVVYRNFNDSSSRLYSIKKPQVLMIAYEKGNVDFFKKEPTIIQRYLFKENFFTYHLADLLINDFTISYEHLFNNGVMFSPISSLSLSTILQLGVRYVPELGSDNAVRTTAAFSFNMSYRF